MTDASANGPAETTTSGSAGSGPWAVAAVLMLVQAVGLAGLGVWSGFDGGTARAWSFAATLVVLAGCVAALAWMLSKRRAAGRTPTLLWNALLIPAGFTVGDGGAPWLGWLLVGVAFLTFGAALLARGGRAADDSLVH